MSYSAPIQRPTDAARRFFLVLLVAFALIAANASSALAADAGSEGQFVSLINASRAEQGLGNLTVYWDLVDDARTHSDAMLASDTLFHNPDLRNVTTGWQSIGENVGYGYEIQGLHDAFMASPGHRANILGDYNYVGIGVSNESDGTIWVTVVFMRGPSGLATSAPAEVGPFPSGEDFVRQQYRDFLSREGDEAGVAAWTNAVDTGSLAPEEAIDQFMASPEFNGRVAPVARLYFATFLRIPDYGGLRNWLNAWQGGWTLEEIADYFTTSEEFQITYGSLSDVEFVTLVYRNVLGRDPDPAGLADWVSRLEAGESRGSILVGFSESQEYRTKSSDSVDVVLATVGMLRRSPEQATFDYWVTRLSTGEPRVLLIREILSSDEYSSRF